MTLLGLGGPEAGGPALGDAIAAAAIAAAAALLCGLGTRALVPLLRRGGALDRPNDRSSHTLPTPRGGGIAVIGTVLAIWVWAAAAGRVSPAVLPVALAAVLLAAVCWLDDLHGLSPLIRLTAQAAAVAVGLSALPESANPVSHFLGPTLYAAALGVLWLWWVNLYNFMDGIDGLAGSEAAAIGGGLVVLGLVGSAADPSVVPLAAAVAGAALGFLVWNWAPARVFLGDVGSVPLGFLTGYLLIAVAGSGRWKAALILPGYFLADATITLGRRLLRGERIWQAHSEHYYQQAVRGGLSHAAVVKRAVAADLLLVACAWLSENGAGLAALATAAAIVAALLWGLAHGR